jgi:putative flavoprotein involved in K+ transport
MCSERLSERVETVVIGGGQAGLSVGYHLAKLGRPYLILDANARVGDSWRQRWDSLRLFTPARFNGLAGMPFPASPNEFPTKDQMGDYLEAYANRFKLRVQTQMTVDRISRRGDAYLVEAGDRRFKADHVVVAMAKYQQPSIPAFAQDLDSRITQLHSSDYRNPEQLRPGAVLIAGAGNSGAEIARELAKHRKVWLSGRDVGQIPFRLDSVPSRLVLGRLVLRVLFHRVLTTDTPMGRKMREKVLHVGGPLIRVKNKHLTALSVDRLPKVIGVRNGLPMVEGGATVDVANVVWCTGFRAGFSWVDLPVFGTDGLPLQERGVVTSQPGLYFVGLHFLYAMSSTMIHGVGRDAEYVANVIAERTRRSAAA